MGERCMVRIGTQRRSHTHTHTHTDPHTSYSSYLIVSGERDLIFLQGSRRENSCVYIEMMERERVRVVVDITVKNTRTIKEAMKV